MPPFVAMRETVTTPAEFADGTGNDGMKTDPRGNLYSTTGAGPGEVRIWSPEGKRLGTLPLPQRGGEPGSRFARQTWPLATPMLRRCT
jgi:hypothetical protein